MPRQLHDAGAEQVMHGANDGVSLRFFLRTLLDATEKKGKEVGSAIAMLFEPQTSNSGKRVPAATEETEPCSWHHGGLHSILKRLGSCSWHHVKGPLKGIDMQTKQRLMWAICFNLAVCLLGVCMSCSIASVRQPQPRQTVTLHTHSGGSRDSSWQPQPPKATWRGWHQKIGDKLAKVVGAKISEPSCIAGKCCQCGCHCGISAGQ